MKIFLTQLMLGLVNGLEVIKRCSTENMYCQPEQIHIAFGEKINDITVTWSTLNDTADSLMLYGVGDPNTLARGWNTKFVDDGELRWFQWIHRAEIKDLKFNTSYVYKVGSQHGWSSIFSFRTPPAGEDWAFSAIVYGDLGITLAKSLDFIIEEVATTHYDMVLHTGDFAYNLHEDNGTWGDKFMNSIQPIATRVPYMVCPGNHEYYYNFSHYRNRFSMPGNTESMYYSYDLGPIHFVSINTEVYYDDAHYYGSSGSGPNVSKIAIETQYNWLVKDLVEANTPENRQKRPWIILYGHRPMLCTNSNDYCRTGNYPHRVGIPEIGGYALEPLLKDYGVDMVIWAHMHSYERMWPVYDKRVYNGSWEHPYTNPGAPVHITSGSAGSREKTDPFYKDPYGWSAFRNSDFGFSKLYVYNSTHLHFEQYSTNPPLSERMELTKALKIDEIWLIKDQHKPYDV